MSNTNNTNNTSKAQILEELRDEEARFEALLQDIGEAHMTQPGVAGAWSVKDVVAHLTFWRRRTVGRFQAALRHEPLPPDPWPAELETDELETEDDVNARDNAINAWERAANRDLPLADVLRESRDVYEQLAETVAAFPEAELLDPATFPWFGAEEFPLTGALFFGHFHDEHEADMRAWLAKVSQQGQ